MSLTYTSRNDIHHPPFLLLCAFLPVWLAFVLYLSHQSPPGDQLWLLFVLPAIGFFGAKFFQGIAFDIQGVVFAGTFFCCFLSPAIYDLADQGRPVGLAVMLAGIALAMAFGFALFRVMGKVFERIP